MVQLVCFGGGGREQSVCVLSRSFFAVALRIEGLEYQLGDLGKGGGLNGWSRGGGGVYDGRLYSANKGEKGNRMIWGQSSDTGVWEI